MRRVWLLLPLILATGCKLNLAPEDENEPAVVTQVTIPNIQLNCVPHGGGSFGKRCTGFVDVSVTPVLPSNYRLGAVLNAMSITGETRTTGAVVTRIPLEGDAIGCPFTQPSHVAVHDDAHLYPNALAIVRINWTTGTLCSNW